MNNKKTNIIEGYMNEYELQKDFIAFFQLQELYEQYKVLTKNNDTAALKYITLLMDVNKKLSDITQMTLKYANIQTETSIMYMQQKK